MNEVAEDLRRRIEDRSVVVGVIGLGYVGLPLGIAFAEAGVRLLGFDVDESKVAAIARGESYIGAVTSAQLAAQVESGRFEATTGFDRLAEADAVLLCVPTPVDDHFEPDLSYVRKAAEQVARTLRKGQLVSLESTTYPGTTDELVRPILEAGGSVLDRDYFLAYSPEREDPGNQEFRTTQIPKVVGGASPDSLALALALYGLVVPRTVAVSSPRVAEATKLTENIFRAVNIALVNELKMIYDDLGIDVREVLDAASTKPFGFMRFDPGPGWGGHCIPVDPFYLAWKAREVRRNARFVELAGTVNVEMPRYVVGKLQRALNDRRKSVRGSRVLLLGLAYKKNVSDPRESPAFEIADQLLELGAEVSYHDPFVPVAPAMRSWPDLPTMHSIDLTAEAVEAVDAVLLVTDHEGVDYELIARSADLIVDTRGVFERRDNIVSA
ncbi:MAG TPA: nucleotide sugar dehydrogenase [Thermoanaerobaculia bacterium]|nr:nucleotide sugar dehydrogenase [Thermoanaerobaculia bacterium]